MLEPVSPLSRLRASLVEGAANPAGIAAMVLAKANGSASRNTYLSLDREALLRRAAELARMPPEAREPLWSVPISLKDCFDLAGTRMTCGSKFYEQRPAAERDSVMAARLHRSGALVTGKTHLHPLAYGITGQNPEYGDCLQPRDAALLTGGSSSGAAASVQEGSALAAIGTDTGGSIRVPAALCGLVGYRASHSLVAERWLEAWSGAAHLAPSFDTLGFLLRDPRDVAPIAHALLGTRVQAHVTALRIGCVREDFLYDCQSEVREAFELWKRELAGPGAEVSEFDGSGWADALEIFAGIQAHEAAALHFGNYDHFEPAIRDRLRWGASLSAEVVASLRERMTGFRVAVAGLFERFDLLMMPCAPVDRLPAQADLSAIRTRILRYTVPFSLAGLPALSLPGELLGAPLGTGVQIAASPGQDALLLGLAESVGSVQAPNHRSPRRTGC